MEEESSSPDTNTATRDDGIPGAEVFARHVLHDNEYSENGKLAEGPVPVSPTTTRLHHSFPCLSASSNSPRYHAKDNLELSFESLKNTKEELSNFGADVFAKHLLHDKEYPEKDLERDPEHRYHLKDLYVPKVEGVPIPRKKKEKYPRRHSEPIVPKKSSATTAARKKIPHPQQTKKADSKRHLKDAFIPEQVPTTPEDQPVYRNSNNNNTNNTKESILPESELEFVSLNPPNQEASAEVFAAHLLHDEEYPPEDHLEHCRHLKDEFVQTSPNNKDTDGSSLRRSSEPTSLDSDQSLPKAEPSLDVSANVFAKNLLHDNEYPQESPRSKRHHLKDQFVPEVIPFGPAHEHFREPTPSSSSAVMVSPLPYVSQDRLDDASNRSVANSLDCASLGSLSYAGHLQKPPLLEEQKENQQNKKHCDEKKKKVKLVFSPLPELSQDRLEDASTRSVADSQDFASLGSLSSTMFEELQKEKRHNKKHRGQKETTQVKLVVSPLPELSQDRLDDASTRAVANSQDCVSLGSLSSPLLEEPREKAHSTRHDQKKEKKAVKQHFRRHSDPLPSRSVIVSPIPPDVSQDKVVDDSSTRSVADSQDWASPGSLTYAGHLQNPPLLEEQMEKQRHKHPHSPKGRKHHFRRHSEPIAILVVPLPADLVSDHVPKDDTSTRSVADSQDCASLGSLSFIDHSKKPHHEEPIKNDDGQHGRPLKGKRCTFSPNVADYPNP